ncbi:MAG: type II toxin-antitoxin system RelE/ParE family toxin [Bacteroidales bacterium]|nr:type II toxin-antitoxin system RelE/ParE family toxin [Bacteroidales bacterium]
MRKIKTFRHYFLDFYNALDPGSQEKIDYALMLLKNQSRISTKFMKYLADGIFELRASSRGNTYRILFFFDKGDIVVLLNGFQKKTTKTPRQSLELAKQLKREYDDNKYGNQEF